MIMSFPEFYAEVQQHLATGRTSVGGLLSGGLNFANLERVAEQRSVSALDVRCDYLQQLSGVAAQGNLSPALLQRAYNSAYTTPIRITPDQLIEVTEQELSQILLDPQRIGGILCNGLLTEFGLRNTVAIKLQDPNATHLMTYQQISKQGLALQKGSSPILLFTPMQQTYFRRDGALVKTLDANATEQLQIVSGELPTTNKVQYVLKQYYDVARLRISPHQMARLEAKLAPQPISSAAIEQFAKQLQNDAGTYLTIVEGNTAAVTSRSIYDSAANKIYLAAHLNEHQRSWELTKRLAEAVTHATSTSPETVKAAEWRIIAMQLSTKWELRPDLPFAAETAKAFNGAQWDMDDTLEASVAKLCRVTAFISNGIGEAEKALEQENKQVQEQKLTMQQAPSSAEAVKESDAVQNFLEGI